MERLFERAGLFAPVVGGSGTGSSAAVREAVVIVDSGASGADARLPLMPVANRPLVLRTLDALARAGMHEVALAVGPTLLPGVRRVVESSRAWPFELAYLELPRNVGLIDALGRAERDATASPVLLHWACGLFNAPLAPLFEGPPVGALDAVILVSPRRIGSSVVDIASQRLAALAGLARSESLGVLAGVAVLGGGAHAAARDVESGRGADLDLLAVVERMVALGGRVRAEPVGPCWRFTGGADSALEANRFVLSNLTSQSCGFGSSTTVVEGPAGIDASAALERSTVRGPAVVGARARVIDAYVGPYTSIGADTCIEGAELENSIVLGGTRISHLGRRLEASVVGPNATVSRDFRLPRAMRVHVGEGATISLA